VLENTIPCGYSPYLAHTCRLLATATTSDCSIFNSQTSNQRLDIPVLFSWVLVETPVFMCIGLLWCNKVMGVDDMRQLHLHHKCISIYVNHVKKGNTKVETGVLKIHLVNCTLLVDSYPFLIPQIICHLLIFLDIYNSFCSLNEGHFLSPCSYLMGSL